MMTPMAVRKVRQLTRALTAEDLRDLAITRKVQDAASRQLPGLVDALISDHHDALLDLLEMKINEVAKEIAS